MFSTYVRNVSVSVSASESTNICTMLQTFNNNSTLLPSIEIKQKYVGCQMAASPSLTLSEQQQLDPK